ncbi:MAG: multicopper oxidase domain-containing protein [Methanomicrobiales archaeon]|nr:multicopper oxidase domain-containing protein [Methanomicrobiales archaeon]
MNDLRKKTDESRTRGVSLSEGWAFLFISLVLLVLFATPAIASPVPPGTLDPTTIPKYVNQLTGPPPVWMKTTGNPNYDYVISVAPHNQQLLPPGFPQTPMIAYGGQARDSVTGKPIGFIRNSPGASFEITTGKPIKVKWVNDIPADVKMPFAVDPTLDWANPNEMATPTAPFTAFPPGYDQAQSPIPIVPHVHGLEVQSTSDGNPDAWFTSDGKQGIAYNTATPTDSNAAIFSYPNINLPATIWYHDHAMGMTRLNVMGGLAGFYLVRQPGDKVAPMLPSGKYEVPLAIQDRIFNPDGTLFFPSVGNAPNTHPYWVPEFFGNTIMVNGLVWPNMNVDQGQYRFRLLDGSNARFYTLSFDNGMSFTQIGTDGGYIRSPVTMTSLTIAPGERADVLVDFSKLAPGTKVILKNTANAPFPDGSEDNADPQTTGQIMQFTVTDHKGFKAKKLPDNLNPSLAGSSWPTLPTPTNKRTLVLYEIMADPTAPGEPTMVTLEGQHYRADVSEKPLLGSTEEWTIVDTTGDTHPIHTHLAQFQLVSRQQFDPQYLSDWLALNPQEADGTFTNPTVHLDVTSYLTPGTLRTPASNELAWKDTIQMNPGEVTTFRIRFAPMDGSGNYPFDATEGPGYVWHCHIIDHEDNEMMRPYIVI